MMISTVKLPVTSGTTTVRDAIELLKNSGRSGLVVVDHGAPVVIDDQMLRNTRIVKGEDAAVSVAADASMPVANSRGFTFFTQAPAPRQPGFAVLEVVKDVATVKTDPRRAEALSTPSNLFDGPATV